MCIFYMCKVVQVQFIKSWIASFFVCSVDINIKIVSPHDFLATYDKCSMQHVYFLKHKNTKRWGYGLRRTIMFVWNAIFLKGKSNKSVVHDKIDTYNYFPQTISEKGWARTTAATTTATTEELPQSIQAPSFTHPGTTYLVRANLLLR